VDKVAETDGEETSEKGVRETAEAAEIEGGEVAETEGGGSGQSRMENRSFRMGKKIWIEDGYQVESKLWLYFKVNNPEISEEEEVEINEEGEGEINEEEQDEVNKEEEGEVNKEEDEINKEEEDEINEEEEDETGDNNGPIRSQNREAALSFELKPCDAEDSSSVMIPIEYLYDAPLSLVPPCIRENPKVAIVATELSQNQKFIVTLSRCDKSEHSCEFYVDVWDISDISQHTSHHPIDPVASSTSFSAEIIPNEIRMFDTEIILMKKLTGVAISPNGEVVAVFETFDHEAQWTAEDGFKSGTRPVQLFQRNPTRTTAVDLESIAEKRYNRSAVQDLVELKYDPTSPLSTFIGEAKFQHRSPNDNQTNDNQTNDNQTAASQGFVLITCDGLRLNVYEAKAGAKLLYTISIIPHLDADRYKNSDLEKVFAKDRYRESCDMLMASLGNTMFEWRSEHSISVWNWRTNRCVGRFPAGELFELSADDLTERVGLNSRDSFRSLREADGCLNMVFCNKPYYSLEWVIRHINTHNVEDHLEVNIQNHHAYTYRLYYLPLLHLSPGSTGTVVSQQKNEIEFSNIDFINTTAFTTSPSASIVTDQHTVCGPGCKDVWESDPDKDEIQRNDEIPGTVKFVKDSGGSISSVVLVHDVFGEKPLLEFSRSYYGQCILPCRTRFFVRSMFRFELWQLPDRTHDECTLLSIGQLELEDFVCKHGILQKHDKISGEWKSSFDLSVKDLLRHCDSIQAIDSVGGDLGFAGWWRNYTPTHKEGLVKFLLRHAHGNEDFSSHFSDKSKTTMMWTIVDFYVKTGDDSLLRDVLGSNLDHGNYWTPLLEREFSADPEKDMIAYLIEQSKFPVARLLIDYCLARAHSTDPVFLDRLMVSMPHIQKKHPDVALEITRRAAFIPVINRGTVLQQAVIYSPWWKRHEEKVNLFEVIDDNPVFHLMNRLPISDGKTKSRVIVQEEMKGISKKNADIKASLYVVPTSIAWTVREKQGSGAVGVDNKETATWMLVLRLIQHFINPLDKVYVHSTFSDLDVFDNSAISTLMTYKWMRFARYFWVVRIFIQVAYEFVVLGVTFYQIYDGKANLMGGYITIIVLGYMLLHLEFQQMRAGLKQYFLSPYNYADLGSYAIPMVASCILLAIPGHINSMHALSFSVVLIYLHFIFEFRIFYNVSRVITIVVNILLEIPAFFAILVVFILSFAHSINHLIEVNFRATVCLPNDDGSTAPCQSMRDEFPKSYLQSVSATYFFMTGDYGPVATSMTNGHWTSQLMVAMFFFLTAVLMMNVVIALMNGVYSDAVEASESIWLKNRVDFITGAENLTFYLPSFRDRFDYFPKYVYYTATYSEVEEYRKKHELDKSPLQFDFSPIPTSSAADIERRETVKDITNCVVEAMETKMEEMKKEHKEEMQKMEEMQKEYREALQKMMELLLAR
ncbi:hypothetical protein BGZ46_002655, partial [Entomortierella lignicola]